MTSSDSDNTGLMTAVHCDWTCPVCRLDLADNRDTMVPSMLLGCRTMAHGICAACALELRRKDVAFKCPTCRAEALMIIPIRPLVSESAANAETLTLLGGDAAVATSRLSPPGRFIHSWVYVFGRVIQVVQNIAILLIILATVVTLVENASNVIVAFCRGLADASQRIVATTANIADKAAQQVVVIGYFFWRCFALGADLFLKLYHDYTAQVPFLATVQCTLK